MKPRYRSMLKKMEVRESRAPAPATAANWSLYILRCGDGSFYTGVTNDIDRRFRAHQEGKASRFTRTRRPVALVRVPGIEFALEDLGVDGTEHLRRVDIVLESRRKVDGMLPRHVWHQTGIAQRCGPVEVRLPGAHDHGGAIEHGGRPVCGENGIMPRPRRARLRPGRASTAGWKRCALSGSFARSTLKQIRSLQIAQSAACRHYELQDSIEHPAFTRAQSGRFAANASRPGCSS